jgi:hypothetical protein
MTQRGKPDKKVQILSSPAHDYLNEAQQVVLYPLGPPGMGPLMRIRGFIGLGFWIFTFFSLVRRIISVRFITHHYSPPNGL